MFQKSVSFGQVCGEACFSRVYREFAFPLEMPEPLSPFIIAFCYGHVGLIVHDFAAKFTVYLIPVSRKLRAEISEPYQEV